MTEFKKTIKFLIHLYNNTQLAIMYFEDFYEGYFFRTNEKEITEKDIIFFEEKWDNQPSHLNETQHSNGITEVV